MIALKTQTPAYWQDEFQVDVDDLDHIHQLILDAGEPVQTSTLVRAIITRRCNAELEKVKSDLHKGEMYQPKDSYHIGQTLLFPAFGFSAGTVVGSRPGYDPAHGEFTVIQVQFEGSDETREFASELASPHVLNRAEGENGLSFLRELIAAEELVERYAPIVERKLREALSDPDRSGMVEYHSRWMVKEMLPAIHVGHLNIAEAAIEVAGVPMASREILKHLDLPTEIDISIQEFALNAAIGADPRFDDVGWEGHVVWYLRRLEPPEIVQPPLRLQWPAFSVERAQLPSELLLVEAEIDDEAISSIKVSELEVTPYSAQITLTYPHWRSGTLPLSHQLRAMLPRGSYQHTRVELIDGQRGEPIPGWIHHELGYIAGLSEWYARHQIPAGAILRLERTKQPNVVIIDFEQRRMRREWVRVADVVDGRISFGMQKRPIACVHDELMALDHVDANRIDQFVTQVYQQQRSLSDLMREVVPELIKLSPAGSVHAKTIYAAMNVFVRCPPRPVFAILASQPRYLDLGNGLWGYHEL